MEGMVKNLVNYPTPRDLVFYKKRPGRKSMEKMVELEVPRDGEGNFSPAFRLFRPIRGLPQYLKKLPDMNCQPGRP